MKRLVGILIFLAVFQIGIADGNNIVPTPQKIEKRNGAFTILTTTKITHYPELRSSAEYLAEYLPLEIREYNENSNGNIVLVVNKKLADEEYHLTVDSQAIKIEGSTPAGVHNAIESLLQMLPDAVYRHQLSFPTMVAGCHVEDKPRFAYRGFMLDVSRTWVTVDELKIFIANMAHHKLNKLHLHLTDDEGWRIEIKSHPELTEKGAFRGKDYPVAARYGKLQDNYGGYYTQGQMRDVVAYAAARNIEIIPEIDLPGHSTTLAHVHPEILCNYTPGLTSSVGYDTRNVVCATKEDNYRMLNDILLEIADIFPSKYIHIGGDEVSTSQWSKCPDCKALMAKLGIDVSQLQDYFMARVAAMLEGMGKQVAVWNEAAASEKLTRKAMVYGWENVEACRKAAAAGYPTVVMPGVYFYFDMQQSSREPGHNWAAIFDARKVLSFDMATHGFTEQEMTHVQGVQASFFSELYLPNREAEYDYLYYQTYPRICALCELAWRGNGGEWSQFYSRLVNSHYNRMVAMGIDFRLFPPTVNFADGKLTAKVNDRSSIYYKIVGQQGEYRYEGPISTDTPQRYSFFSRMGGAVSPEQGVQGRWRMLQPNVKITSSIAESEKYPYKNAEGYGRIAHTSKAASEGDWVMYTFEKPVTCRRLEIATGNLTLPRFVFDAGYMEVSYDGTNFKRVCDLEQGAGVIENPAKPIKAVRITCTQTGNGDNYVTVQPPKVYPKL